jgi:recombination protein RecT
MDFDFIQDPNDRLAKPIIGFVSYFKLNNGFEHSFYMTNEEMLAHGKEYSQTFKKDGKGLWKDKFDAMALKTVTKLNLSKNGPLSIELQRAIITDQAVIKSDSFLKEPETLEIEATYVDNQEETKEEKVDSAKLVMRISQAKDLKALEKLKTEISEEDTDTYTLYVDKKKELAAGTKNDNLGKLL